jgi:hypothetical protein
LQEKEADLRRGIVLVEKAASVVSIKDAGETPGLILEGLDVHDLDKEDVARLGALDVEGAAQVVDLGEVDIENVVGRVVVADLAAGPAMCQNRGVWGARVDLPVDTFDLDGLAILDGGDGGDWGGC